MENNLVTIEAVKRTACGKGQCRKLRKNNLLPAVLLDKGQSTLLEFNPKYLPKAYKENGHRFNLSFEGNTRVVCVKELQIDKVRREPLHVDLIYSE